MNTAFFSLRSLLQLDRSRRLAGQIVEYAVDTLDFIDDAGHAGLQPS